MSLTSKRNYKAARVHLPLDLMGSCMCSPYNYCYRERDNAVKTAAIASDQSGKKAEEASKKHSKSSAAVRRLEADVAKLTNQVAALEHANRSAP